MAQIERNNTIDINHNDPAPSDTPPPSSPTSVNTGHESTPNPIGESNSTGSPTTSVVATTMMPGVETVVVTITPEGQTLTSIGTSPSMLTTIVVTYTPTS